jgi:phosphoglycerate dehydrogenase-like enzyme
MRPPKALFILDPDALHKIYGPDEQAEIASLVDVIAPPQSARTIAERPDLLRDVEILFSGWGAPTLDAAFLDRAPNLRAIFYGAGSVRYFTTPAVWARGLKLTSAYAANAVPVMEYTVSCILLSLKHFWKYGLVRRESGHYYPEAPIPGTVGSTVGLISLGMIGRLVAGRLADCDLDVIAYDPWVDQAACDGDGLRVTMVDNLERIFTQSDVVSLHAPRLPETKGMITGALLGAMKPDAAFINTARGSLVREPEMIEVLRRRPDLWAILDVLDPEPPAPENPLPTLPNVLLTPHIAGSTDRECHRMGQTMIAELRRYLAGEPLEWEIDEGKAARLA